VRVVVENIPDVNGLPGNKIARSLLTLFGRITSAVSPIPVIHALDRVKFQTNLYIWISIDFEWNLNVKNPDDIVIHTHTPSLIILIPLYFGIP